MFMFYNILNLFFIFLMISVNDRIKEVKSQQLANNSSNYVIKNLEYPDEYLMNAGSVDVYSTSEKIKRIEEIFWIFEKINGLNDTYFIKSSLNNKYICATFGFLERFTKLRKPIRLMNIEIYEDYDTIFTMCQWRFEKISKDENIYRIINIRYKTPLYSAGYLLKVTRNGKSYRQLFLWHGKSSKVDEFKWKIYLII